MKKKSIFLGIFSILFAMATINAMATTNDDTSLYGASADAVYANRTIVIGPGTTYVNVTGGEIIKFVANGKTFTWNFDGLENLSFIALNEIAPSGLLDHTVKAYIARNPLYQGGN